MSREFSQTKTPFVKPLLAGVVIACRHRVNNWSIHELMQVAVSPSHYNLKDIVQAIEVDTSGYLNTPPNGRFAATQSNFEFVKGQVFVLMGAITGLLKTVSRAK